MTTTSTQSVSQHVDRADKNVPAIYGRILVEAHRLGPVDEDSKKTSISYADVAAFEDRMAAR